MEPRLKPREVAPEGFRAFLYLQRYIDACDLEHSLLDLIRLRASQIDGCAYCIDAPDVCDHSHQRLEPVGE